MIKNVIYVEDGSVDVDLLEEELSNDTKIIVYRQGSTPPKIEQLEKPISTSEDDYRNEVLLNVPKVKEMFRELQSMKQSKKVYKKCKEIYNTLFNSGFSIVNEKENEEDD